MAIERLWATRQLGWFGERLPKYREGEDTFLSDEKTVWFVTQNPNKFREAKSILTKDHIPLKLWNRPKIEIQSQSLAAIARFAAEQVAADHKGLILVEDSGLFIASLGGFPGPFSSFVLPAIGLGGILHLMERERRRAAYFQCSIAVSSRFQATKTFSAKAYGTISRQVRGHKGFGYDPIFVPSNSNRTFAEVGPDFKNVHSHRAIAFRKFARWYHRNVASLDDH